MQKLFLAMVTLGLATTGYCSLESYYPTEYRNSFENLRAQDGELKNQLFQVLTSFHQTRQGEADVLTKRCEFEESPKKSCYQQISLGYKEARRQLFGYLHLKEDESGMYLEDLYCDRKMRSDDFADGATIGKLKIPSSIVTNCEHTWPQSRFTGKHSKGMQKADLHHLFPTDSQANSKRGNHPFGEVKGKPVNSDCTASQSGRLEYVPSGNSGKTYFEPPANHRGNVARAIFYFSVRYQIPIDANQEYFLRKWHREDPVDQSEMERNDKIEGLQYNRNPFIDFPQLVEQISDF